MEPEKQSEGSAPEDLLFGGSSQPNAEGNQQAPESTPPVAPATEPPSNTEVDDTASPASQLDDPSPSDALKGEAPKDDGKSDAADAKPAYEAFDIPEGVDSFSEPVLSAFSDTARELGLTQEQAQKLVTAIGGAQRDVQQSTTQSHYDNWAKQTRADKEVGGVHYKPSLANVRRAVDKFATPEMRQLLVGKTQLVNHPEMFRFLARVGAAISPDRSLVTGQATSAKPKVDVKDPLATPDALADMLYG